MHQHYRTRGIVLAKKDSGEADQIFTLYTCDFGKLEVIGKSIRKITSKLRQGIDVFYFTEIEFIQGKSQKILTDAILLDKYSNIRQNIQKLSLAFQINEVVSSLANREEKDERVWNLLFLVFNQLNNCQLQTANCQLICHYFLWNFFSLLGYTPGLYCCACCEKKLLAETFFFVPNYGGVVCWQCFSKIKREKEAELKQTIQDPKKIKEILNRGASEITVDAVKMLRFFLKEPMEKTVRLITFEKELTCLNNLAEYYLAFLAES